MQFYLNRNTSSVTVVDVHINLHFTVDRIMLIIWYSYQNGLEMWKKCSTNSILYIAEIYGNKKCK